MRKLLKIIPKNAIFIFILISILWTVFGPNMKGDIQPHEVRNGAWLLPSYNRFNRFITSLNLSLPIAIIVSIIDKIFTGFKRTLIFLLYTADYSLFDTHREHARRHSYIILKFSFVKHICIPLNRLILFRIKKTFINITDFDLKIR